MSKADRMRPIYRPVASWAKRGNRRLGSGLIGHSQKMTVAASAMAEKKAVGQRS